MQVSHPTSHNLMFLTKLPIAIQGRDCLIQKFRNSSVMLEPPHYRPKVEFCLLSSGSFLTLLQLFFTTNDPFNRAGQEDEFPSSDNASKLKRSCENAEHVGMLQLYSPEQDSSQPKYRTICP